MSRSLGDRPGAYERRAPLSVVMAVGLSSNAAKELLAQAARRGVTSESLLTRIVETVLTDRLLDAVLDE